MVPWIYINYSVRQPYQLSLTCRRRTSALRALVVLPTRDLASQVYRVFARMCPGMGLTVGLMAGKANEVR